MATINFATREISAKIVYIGASGAGSNTNVRRLYETLEAEQTSRLHMFGPDDSDERSWFFQYLRPHGPHVASFAMRCQVYSLPGGLVLDAHREEVLGGADALVFVADARPDRQQANLDALIALEEQLAAQGMELSAAAVVVQVNHTDHDDALPPERVGAEINPFGFPQLAAVARDGEGVGTTHAEVVAAIEDRLRDHLGGNDAVLQLVAVHDPETPTDDDIVAGHVQAIQERSEAQASAAVDALSERQIEHLPEGPIVEVPFQPREFVGSQPSRVLDVTVDRDEVSVDLVMERMGGGTPRRLLVRLVNRPTDTPALARSAPVVQHAPTGPQAEDRVFDYLPESVEITHPGDRSGDDDSDDMPPLAYGLLGLSGGIVIGGLLAYLVGSLG